MLLHAILLCRLMVITFYKCHMYCKTQVHAYNFSQVGTITRYANSKKGNHENPSQQLLARNHPNQGWFPHQRSSLTFTLASNKCARCLLSSSTIITSSTRVFKTLVFLSHNIYKNNGLFTLYGLLQTLASFPTKGKTLTMIITLDLLHDS